MLWKTMLDKIVCKQNPRTVCDLMKQTFFIACIDLSMNNMRLLFDKQS